MNGQKIVTFTPAGRKRYLEILVEYLWNNRGVIDHHEFWINVPNENVEDRAFILGLCNMYPTMFKAVEVDTPGMKIDAYRIAQFYKTMEPDTMYIRLDDDIVYIEEGALLKLIDARQRNQNPYLVFPTIVNNSIIAYHLQNCGYLSFNPKLDGTNVLNFAWENAQFAEDIHERFLRDLDAGNKWRLSNDVRLDNYVRVSINSFAFYGRDILPFKDEIHDEEQFLSVDLPKRLSRPNLIIPDALISHFSYYTQREYLDKTGLLERYRHLALRGL